MLDRPRHPADQILFCAKGASDRSLRTVLIWVIKAMMRPSKRHDQLPMSIVSWRWWCGVAPLHRTAATAVPSATHRTATAVAQPCGKPRGVQGMLPQGQTTCASPTTQRAHTGATPALVWRRVCGVVEPRRDSEPRHMRQAHGWHPLPREGVLSLRLAAGVTGRLAPRALIKRAGDYAASWGSSKLSLRSKILLWPLLSRGKAQSACAHPACGDGKASVERGGVLVGVLLVHHARRSRAAQLGGEQGEE
jgi:hypothetical protein